MTQEVDTHIVFTTQALQQIQLMIENDYTIEGKILRLTISGKECDGFVYDLGFTESVTDDVISTHQLDRFSFSLARDPFTAHYFKHGDIDFKLDIENNSDGFVINNHEQHNYQGKFFKDDSLTPDHLENKK
jgi:iron-sulfur cluster insertion protein